MMRQPTRKRPPSIVSPGRSDAQGSPSPTKCVFVAGTVEFWSMVPLRSGGKVGTIAVARLGQCMTVEVVLAENGKPDFRSRLGKFTVPPFVTDPSLRNEKFGLPLA